MAPLAPFVSEALYRNLVARRDPAAPCQVHLCDLARTRRRGRRRAPARHATLQRVVELGRAARAASGHKTRQPLPEVLVRVPSEAELEGLKRLEDALRDELNVKAVRYLDPTDPFVAYDVEPNLPGRRAPLGQAGPRDPRGAGDGRRPGGRGAVAEGRPFELELEGGTVALAPDELLLDARSPEGYAAVEEKGYLAALRTELTPALRREGLMRDAVRLVQDARKQAGPRGGRPDRAGARRRRRRGRAPRSRNTARRWPPRCSRPRSVRATSMATPSGSSPSSAAAASRSPCGASADAGRPRACRVPSFGPDGAVWDGAEPPVR